MRVRKSPVTLIEILIVMSLIVVIAGAVGWNIAGMQKQERFYAAVGQVIEKLHAAQELMLIHNDDVTVVIREVGENAYEISLKTDSPMKSHLGQMITSPKKITGIGSLAFTTEERTLETNIIDLNYAAVGHRTPKGILILSAYPSVTDSGPLKSRIYLTGQPQPITANQKPPEVEESLTESEELYPQEIRDEWQRRIEEKEKKKEKK